MAKELPYFKFEPNEWENGNIQMCSREHKGLFIDLCSMYWSRLGDLPMKLAVQKLCAGNANALNSLCDDKIIVLENGFIRIDFLEEQLAEFENKSKTNRKIALEAWDKRRKDKALYETDANASTSHYESDTIREEKRKEEEIKEEKSKVKKSNEFDFSFVQPEFIETFSMWLQYKKERRENYKSQMSLEQSYKLLLKHSENNPKLATEVVNQTIGNNWAGLQPLKKQFNQKPVLEPYNDKEIWGQR